MSTAAPSPDPASRIDEAALALLREAGGDDEFIVELLGDFEVQCPQALACMRSALAAGDAKSLERHAHTLKGSARSLGATELAILCEALESGVRRGDTSGASERIREIAAAFDRATRDLHALLAARRA